MATYKPLIMSEGKIKQLKDEDELDLGSTSIGDMLKSDYDPSDEKIVVSSKQLNDGNGKIKTAVQVYYHIEDDNIHFDNLGSCPDVDVTNRVNNSAIVWDNVNNKHVYTLVPSLVPSISNDLIIKPSEMYPITSQKDSLEKETILNMIECWKLGYVNGNLENTYLLFNISPRDLAVDLAFNLVCYFDNGSTGDIRIVTDIWYVNNNTILDIHNPTTSFEDFFSVTNTMYLRFNNILLDNAKIEKTEYNGKFMVIIRLKREIIGSNDYAGNLCLAKVIIK